MAIQNTTFAADFIPSVTMHGFFQIPLWKQQQPTNQKIHLHKKNIHSSAQLAPERLDRDTLRSYSDFRLIDLTLEGKHEAFDVLVKRYSGSIYSLAYRMLRNHDDAADISQDVFFKAYEALGSFRKKSSFHTWLYRITTNSCINYLRRNETQHHIEFAAYHAVREADTLDTLYKMELQDVVNEAIEKLPEKQKATVLLRVCEGMSHREVSRILKCSVGTAKANYFHAIRNLRRFMKNYITANAADDLMPVSIPGESSLAHSSVAG